MNTRFSGLVVLVLLAALLAGCMADRAPQPSSDSPQAFLANPDGMPVDDGVYLIAGVVIGDVESLVRQTAPARGTMAGSAYGAYGSYFGPEFGGKGFVRLHVQSSDSELAPVGSIVILKVTDSKASVLLPGDSVEFKCRHQFEAVAAVRDSETFNADKLETWEIDYCRLTTPVIGQ